MGALNYSDFRANLKAVMARVVADREPVLVTRPNAESIVVVSLADWSAMEETSRLLSTATNASRLLEAIGEFEADSGP